MPILPGMRVQERPMRFSYELGGYFPKRSECVLPERFKKMDASVEVCRPNREFAKSILLIKALVLKILPYVVLEKV